MVVVHWKILVECERTERFLVGPRVQVMEGEELCLHGAVGGASHDCAREQ